MTFAELQVKIGQQVESEWHQHKNGGGLVHKKATIGASAYVGENAVVFSGQVFGDAWVSGDAQVSGNAQVFGDAGVSGNAWVSGDAWEKSPLFIVGSRHSLTNAKHGHIQIGCLCNTFKWWAGHYKAVGKQQGYTPAEIKEYGAYIALFSKVGQKEVKVKK